MTIIIYHASFGCDTGCCGHRVQMSGPSPKDAQNIFCWEHPDSDEDKFEWAKDLVAKEFGVEHVRDIDFKNCCLVDDCEGVI